MTRLQDAPVIHEVRAIERDYAAMAFPGSDEPMDEEELMSLRTGEPDTRPWRR